MPDDRVRHTRLFVASAAVLLAGLTSWWAAPAWAASSTRAKHPSHQVKQWTARYQGRTFHVVRLPRCEHLEAVITHDPTGETLAQAKRRKGGVAAMTGAFHNPQSMCLADFLQRDGAIESGASTGRWFLALLADGTIDITNDYAACKGRAGISAMALGQRLVPLHRDGFSVAFMNRRTERMALGLTRDHIYIVSGQTDLWRLASFLRRKLRVSIAINSDGGHVVRGRAPVHVVFRWRKATAPVLASLQPGVGEGPRPAPRKAALSYTAAPARRSGP